MRVSYWSQEGNKSAEIGSSKVTGNEWYHFSRFSVGNFPKIRMLPGGCVSRAHHPFFRRGSGRCWCCPPTFGPLPPRLLPLPPFSISALNASHNAFTPLPFGNTVLVLLQRPTVVLWSRKLLSRLIVCTFLPSWENRLWLPPMSIYRCLINWNVTFSPLRNWFTTSLPSPGSSIDNFDSKELGNVNAGHAWYSLLCW